MGHRIKLLGLVFAVLLFVQLGYPQSNATNRSNNTGLDGTWVLDRRSKPQWAFTAMQGATWVIKMTDSTVEIKKTYGQASQSKEVLLVLNLDGSGERNALPGGSAWVESRTKWVDGKLIRKYRQEFPTFHPADHAQDTSADVTESYYLNKGGTLIFESRTSPRYEMLGMEGRGPLKLVFSKKD